MCSVVSRSVSPDSDVACRDPQCSINVDHNIGRFFDNGFTAAQVQEELNAAHFRGIIAFSAFFEGAVPTLPIIEAFVRLNEGRSSTEDEEMLKSFKNLHCVQPLALDMLSHRSDAHARHCPNPTPKKGQMDRMSSLKRSCGRQQSIRRQKAQIFRPTPDESIDQATALEATTPESIDVIVNDEGEESTMASKPTMVKRIRSVGNPLDELCNLQILPAGTALQEAQLDIQLRICKQIAERAAQGSGTKKVKRSVISHIKQWRPHKRSRDDSKLSGTSDKCSEESTEMDHKLEIHVATIRKLETRLGNGSWEDIDVVDPLGRVLQGDVKKDFLGSMLLIIRRMLREIIADLDSEYRPTKQLVTESAQMALLEEYTSTIDMLGDVYPDMEIRHIIEALDKTGERARLTKVF